MNEHLYENLFYTETLTIMSQTKPKTGLKRTERTELTNRIKFKVKLVPFYKAKVKL